MLMPVELRRLAKEIQRQARLQGTARQVRHDWVRPRYLTDAE